MTTANCVKWVVTPLTVVPLNVDAGRMTQREPLKKAIFTRVGSVPATVVAAAPESVNVRVTGALRNRRPEAKLKSTDGPTTVTPAVFAGGVRFTALVKVSLPGIAPGGN